MVEVQRLLRVAGARIERVDPSSPPARWCVEQYFAELARRFEEGFDPAKSIPADDDELCPPKGAFLLASTDGEPVACGAGPIAVTVSAGVADCAPGRDFDDLFSHADRALYLAKVSGRNRVVHERAVAGVVPPTRYEAPFGEIIRDLGGSRFATMAATRHQPKA